MIIDSDTLVRLATYPHDPCLTLSMFLRLDGGGMIRGGQLRNC